MAVVSMALRVGKITDITDLRSLNLLDNRLSPESQRRERIAEHEADGSDTATVSKSRPTFKVNDGTRMVKANQNGSLVGILNSYEETNETLRLENEY
eukprot:TRINITY_DN4154_c0_g1_i1.p2 TRINITY_DN4154_c0_g1~~TRINITY_DN4154_c0_g1_i1.p2  ORF type:complete len:97 (-),score=8.57 TRINITY_DN4154_c0_g1_i1:64-354(-)